jgi:hypothetical protein
MKKLLIDPDLLKLLQTNPNHAEPTVLVHLAKTGQLGGDLYEAPSAIKPVLMACSKAKDHKLWCPAEPQNQGDVRAPIRLAIPLPHSGEKRQSTVNQGSARVAVIPVYEARQPASAPAQTASSKAPLAAVTSNQNIDLPNFGIPPQATPAGESPQLDSTFYWDNEPDAKLLSPAKQPSDVENFLGQTVRHSRSRITGDATMTGWKGLSMAIINKSVPNNAAAGGPWRADQLLEISPKELLTPAFKGRIWSLCKSQVRIKVTDLSGRNISFGSSHSPLDRIRPHQRYVTVAALTAVAVAMRLRNELPAVAYIMSIAPESFAQDVKIGRLAQAFGSSGMGYLQWSIFHRIGQRGSIVSQVPLPSAAADLIVAQFLRHDGCESLNGFNERDYGRLIAVLKLPDWFAFNHNPNFWAIRHGVTYGALLLYANQINRRNISHLRKFNAVLNTHAEVLSPTVGSTSTVGVVRARSEIIATPQAVRTARKQTAMDLENLIKINIQRVLFTQADAGKLAGCTQQGDMTGDPNIVKRFKTCVTSIMEAIAARSIG